LSQEQDIPGLSANRDGHSLKSIIITPFCDMQKLYIQFAVFLIILCLLPGYLFADSAHSLVESGNEAFSQGDYAAAFESYEKAAASGADSAIILFNKGDALYKQDKFAEALDVFEQATAKAVENKDQALEAQSRYNMGNSAFRKAEGLSRENPQMALEEYKRSSGYYQAAVKLNPDLSEAGHNLEVARMAARQIEDLIRQQQQQSRQQAQQRQDIARELENLQQEQQHAAEQSKDLGQPQKQQSVDHDAEQQAGHQRSITERTRRAEEKLERLRQEQNSQFSEDKVREHLNRAIAKQEEAEKKLLGNDMSEAYENQQDAAGELQKALQQLVQGREQEQKSENTKQEPESRKDGAEQQEQQASEEAAGESNNQRQPGDASLSGESPEDILNEEIENRKYRSVRGGTGYKPVDRDW